MTTALTTTDQQLPARTHLGDRDQIAAIHSRMASMMQLPADVPEDVVRAAAQLSVAYRLNPFIGEIYVMELGKAKDDVTGQWVKQYRAHIGIKGLRTLARRVANFTIDLTEMDAAEVKKFRGENYAPEDIGVRCTLWRLDTARECKDAGIPYKPNVAMGFWRKKAQYNKALSKWFEDNVPNTWVPYQVAEKRAEINAIRMAFDLNIDIGDPSVGGDEQTYTVMSQAIHDEDMAHALPAPRNDVVVEDDGEILFATSDARHNGKKQAATPPQGVRDENVPGDTVTPQGEPSAPSCIGDDEVTNLYRLAEKVYGDAWSDEQMNDLLIEVLGKHYTPVGLLRQDEAKQVSEHLWRIIDERERGLTDAPDPIAVAVGELTGQKLGVILEWGMAHGQMNKEETRALWDSIRATGLDGPATLAAFVQNVLTPDA